MELIILLKRKHQTHNNKYKTRLSLLFYFLKGSKRYFLLSLIFAGCVSVLDLIFPKIIAFTVDRIITDTDSSASYTGGFFNYIVERAGGYEYIRANMYLVALFVLLMAFLAVTFRYLFQFFNSLGAESLIKRIRDLLYDHILKLPMSWHSSNHTGDIIQRATSDVETVKNFLSDQLTNFIRVIVLIVLSIAFMASINLPLTLVAVILMPVIILYSLIFHGKIASSFLKVDEMEGRVSSIVQENLTGVRVVRAFGRESYEQDRFVSMNERYVNTWIHLMRLLSKFWATGDLISGLQILFILVAGSILCVNGNISAGNLIAFISYNSLLTWPIRMLARVVADMGKAGVSIDRIQYILNSEPEDFEDPLKEQDSFKELSDPKAIRELFKKDIEFKNVSFSYKEGAMALSDISFRLKGGQTLGILGSTGSGKSTLINLLDRMYDPDKGSILIGGTDIRSLDRRGLRENIGLVLQEPFLFSGTIRENLIIACREPSEEKVKKAVKTAALEETIRDFTRGYETYVGERGITLSGGQKQRLAIARMLLTECPVMIFDDSLSAVDSETDLRIRNALKESDLKATRIIISHRISTIMNSDLILVLDKGRLIESGSHEELLSLKGKYKRFYDLQNFGLE
ncbi:MAG: ABC transporter ATP-binding protein/permease [Lachnospiraceae bacterium]|nr:ABC transporter ATP-binding protein/permease [Lachnospiraceae bacterium]